MIEYYVYSMAIYMFCKYAVLLYALTITTTSTGADQHPGVSGLRHLSGGCLCVRPGWLSLCQG